MIRSILAAVSLVLVSSAAMANEGDLTLPGERWVTKFDNYICNAFQPSVQRPADYEALDVKFEKASSDRTLSNVILVANFKVNGATCRYSAILLGDKKAFTAQLVTSKAYAPNEDADCTIGKNLLDSQLAQFPYLYYGHPHHIGFVLPFADAEQICGAGATNVVVDFVLAGRIQQ